MKYLLLLVLGVSIGPIVSELLQPVVKLVEPIVEPVLEAVETIATGTHKPIYTGVLETPANKLIRDIIGPADENNLDSTRERVLRVGNELGIIVEDNEDDVTNPDNFVTPCPDIEDLDCIRKFLSENSECKPVPGPAPDLHLLQATAFYSSINITLTLSDFKIEGLTDAKVIKLYYNKVTNNIIIAIQVTLKVTIPRVFISFRRPGKESIVKSDFAKGEFEGVILTIILRKMPNVCLTTAEIHSFVPDASPLNFVIGPKALTSLNPEVVTGVAAFLASIPILYRENLTFQGPFVAVHIIQNLLCDFGVELVSA